MATTIGGLPDFMADFVDAHDSAEQATLFDAKTRETLKAARKAGEAVNARYLRAALREFDELWDALFPTEKNRALHLLIERVLVNVSEGDVAITFRPNGIRTLAEEART